MEFTLAIAEQFGALSPAEQKHQLLATNRDAWTSYGLQLTPEEASMILKTADKALQAQDLVQFGESITPRLIHWFLPSGYLGRNYALRVAALTEAFYQIKGSLQTLYDEADDPDCVLSDNAILDYMYRFFVSPTCAGDIEEMLVQTERIVVGGMRRLLEYRAEQRKQAQADLGDPELRMLYADKLHQEELPDAFETEYEQEVYDYAYREEMHQDVFGNYAGDYDEERAVRTRGTYAEELEEALRRNPTFLLPSKAQEAEWERMTEQWETLDENAAQGEEA